MFKIANAINLFFAGQKVTSLIGAPSGNELPDVKNRVIFQALDGSFWGSLGLAILNGFSKLLYMIVRWILNIVDFLQFFVKHLLGVDYWEKGNVKLDTLGDSDIIFKFLYNETVQRVFKYMLGLFVVLLVLFAIIAIVKSQYAVASDADKANNDPMSVLKRCMKAIFLVVIVPVMLVMGLLASNAVLAGLINTFNVNNRLTLGGQVFSASAYDANRYRKYAENGKRYSVTNHVNVTLEGAYGKITKKINTLVTPVVPRNYGSDNKFTGFAFTYKGKDYLYYVPESELNTSAGNGQSDETLTYYDFYVEYFTNVLGVTLKENGSGWGESNANKKYLIKAALNECEEKSSINQAAYNSWYFNGVAFEASAPFENTVERILASEYDSRPASWENGWISDSGNIYSDAVVYKNNDVWGAFHDGGKNGLVTIPDEYLVMGDVIDFTIGDATEIAYVNAKSSKIDWTYGNATEGGYLSSRYVNTTSNGQNVNLNSFVVNYKNSGYVVYDLPTDADLTAESDGVVYIVAYYSSSRGKFIPLVNGKTYVDDYGEEHKFKSDNLDDNYRGLIVARGILESSFKNQYGNPTEINLDWGSDVAGGSVTTDTALYYRASARNVKSRAELSSVSSNNTTIGYNSSNVTFGGNSQAFTRLDYVETINNTVDIFNDQEKLSAINASLPTQFTYRTTNVAGTIEGVTQYGAVDITLQNIQWTALGKLSTIDLDRDIIVFKSNKTIKARIPAGAVTNVGETTEVLSAESEAVYDLPLYVFVSYWGTGNSQGTVRVEFIISYYQNPTDDFFACTSTNTKGCTAPLQGQNSGKIKANYNIDGISGNNGIVGEYIHFGVPQDGNSNLMIHFESNSNVNTLVFNTKRESLTSKSGSIFEDPNNIETTMGQPCLEFEILRLYNDYSKDVIKYDGAEEVNASASADGKIEYHYYMKKSTEGKNGPVVRVSYNIDTHELKLTNYKVYYFVVDGHQMYIGKSDNAYTASPYEMTFNSSRTDSATNKTIYSYTYFMNSANYYFEFEYNCSNGIETLTPIESDLVNITLTYHNMFAFGVKSGSNVEYYQHSPVTGESTKELKNLVIKSAYVRPESIYSKYLSKNDSEYIWTTEVTLEDSDKTPFATFYSVADHDGSSQINGLDAINNSNRAISGAEDLKVVQVYDSGEDISSITEQHLKSTATVTFSREYVSGNQFFLDFQLFSSWFNKKTWRLEICFGAGFSANKYHTSAFQILDASLRLDYNFTSKSAPSLELQIYYIPMLVNFVILVFAACLLLTMLGKAVWGLIQRIFDITLYFIILPGVASLMPFDDGAKFSSWKDGVISKTISAYGVMIGLNLFFILCPAIKSISHLFTQADLDSLAEGNFLRGVSPGFINSVSELLFMLVALTMIQTAPGIIQDFVNTSKTKAEVTKMGDDAKKNVKGMTADVGATISGSKALDFVRGEKGKGFMGNLKNFVPGSAIYDEVKKKFKKSDNAGGGGGGHSDAQRAAEERRRADAEASLAQSQDLSADANYMAAPQINADQILPEGAIDETATNEANANAEAQQDQTPAAAENIGLTESAEEGIGESVAENVRDTITEMREGGSEAQSSAEARTEGTGSGTEESKDTSGHVAFADVAGRVQDQSSTDVDVNFEGSESADENAEAILGAEQISGTNAQADDSGANAERARMYAESARLAADASRGFADIAGGKVDENYGIVQEAEKTRDQKKLDSLLAERDERLKAQAEGNADVSLAPALRGKAYKQYNENKAAEDSIFDANSEAIKQAAIKRWNDTKETAIDENNGRLVDQAVNEWKDAQALKLYNDKNKTRFESANELTKKELSEARDMLAEDQKVKKAVARSEYSDKILDDKIAKQQEKIALKEAGLYEAPLKKVLLAAPRAIFSHKTSDEEESKLQAKLDKWEKIGTEANTKLADMEATYQNERKEFIENNKLVIKNGKIDREATAKGMMSKLDVNDREAVQKEMEYRAKEFDKLEKEYSKFNDKDSYIENRREELTSDLSKARRRFDVYSAQLQNGRSGLAHAFAREAKSGARAIKSSWQNNRAEAAARAEAKTTSKTTAAVLGDELKRDKLKIDWSKVGDQGLDVNHENHTYSASQRKALQSKYAAIISAEAKLRVEKIAARSKGVVFKENGDIDRIATAKELMRKENPKKYTGAIAEQDAVKYMRKNIQKIDELQTGYLNAQSSVSDAKKQFVSRVHKYDMRNEQTFLGRNAKLQSAALKRATAEKNRLVTELNNATRSGRLEEGQEAEYLARIQGVDATIDQIAKHPARYKAARVVKTKNNTQATARIGQLSYADQARQILSGEAKVTERKSTISTRDSLAAQRTAEKVGREEARKTMLDETTQRAYISQVRKALMQSGYAGDISKIRTTEDAKRVAKEVEAKLMNAARENSEAFARKSASGVVRASELAEFKAQEKLINQRLKKIRSVDTNVAMNSTLDIKKEIKASSDRAIGAAIRNQYKDEWNKFMKKEGMRDVAKSGSAAYEKNLKMQKQLMDDHNALSKRLKALEASGLKSEDTKIKSLQSKLDEQTKLISSLKSMNSRTEEQAKKAMKNFTSMNKIMQDMRRQSKYKIPGLKNQGNGNDAKN